MAQCCQGRGFACDEAFLHCRSRLCGWSSESQLLRTQHMSTNADEGEKKGEESEGRCKNPRGVGGWVPHALTCTQLVRRSCS